MKAAPHNYNNDWNLEGFSAKEFDVTIESKTVPNARAIRFDGKTNMQKMLRREKADQLIPKLPEPGEVIHLISNGEFDYWDVIADAIKKLGPCHFHGSTWTMNRRIALEILAMLDDGRLLSCCLITGIYFKRRETAVYATIASGLLERRQKFRALETHAKIACLSDTQQFIVFEGSANFTANPRIENNILANHEGLYHFHREWIEEAATAQD